MSLVVYRHVVNFRTTLVAPRRGSKPLIHESRKAATFVSLVVYRHVVNFRTTPVALRRGSKPLIHESREAATFDRRSAPGLDA